MLSAAASCSRWPRRRHCREAPIESVRGAYSVRPNTGGDCLCEGKRRINGVRNKEQAEKPACVRCLSYCSGRMIHLRSGSARSRAIHRKTDVNHSYSISDVANIVELITALATVSSQAQRVMTVKSEGRVDAVVRLVCG